MEYQVTILCATNQYRPISTIIKTDETDRKAIQKKGIEKICVKKLWTVNDLKKYNYTKVKIREYDKEKIAEQNAENYAKLKAEKYASGEWKKPKKEV